ncbi:MAG: hypothetical protein AAF725_05115 [Acidobacteriota bacterium]
MRLIPRILFLALLLPAVPAHAGLGLAFSQTFEEATVGPGNTATLRFDIDSQSGSNARDLAFVNNFPAGLTVANPSGVFTDCGATAVLSATPGDSSFSLSGGQLAAGQSCIVRVNVVSSAAPVSGSPVVLTNTPGTLSSSLGPAFAPSADLTITADLPAFRKSFSPSSISTGQLSRLTFTVDNSLSGEALGRAVFLDSLPNGLVVASPSNAITDCPSPFGIPVVSAAPGGTTVGFSGFGFLPTFPVLAAGDSCSVEVDVLATQAGVLGNTAENLEVETMAAGVTVAGKASAVLIVLQEALTKNFLNDPVRPGSSVDLEFMITNFSRADSLLNVAFQDDLAATLAGLTLSGVVSNDCGGAVGGTGTSLLTFSGGTLPPEGVCAVRVSLAVPPGAAPGAYPNTTSVLTGTVGGAPLAGNQASDVMRITAAPTVTKAFLTSPVLAGATVDLEFTVTNVDPNFAATDITFTDPLVVEIASLSAAPPSECCGTGSTCLFSPVLGSQPTSIQVMNGNLAAAGSAGDSCTFTFTLNVSSDASPGLYLNEIGDVSATLGGVTQVGVGGSDTLEVIAGPSLSKSFTPIPALPGSTATLEFTLELSANSPTAATNITFTDDLAAVLAGLTAAQSVVSDPCGAGSSLTASAGDTLLTLAGGSLNPGESCTFSVDVNIPAAAPSGSFPNVTSGVSATVSGQSVTSDAASANLQVAGLVLSKEFLDGPYLPGDQPILRFTLENTGSEDATGILFTDNLPSALSGLAAVTLPADPCGAGSTITGPSFLIFNNGSLLAGETCTFDVTTQIPFAAADGTYANVTSTPVASIGGAMVALQPATALFDVNSSVLSLFKEFTDDPVGPGGTVNLRFSLMNLDEGSTVTNVGFTDALDDALSGLVATGLPISACGGTLQAGATPGDLQFTGGTLTALETCDIDVSLSVPPGAVPGLYENTTSAVTGMLGPVPVTGPSGSDVLEVIDLLNFTKAFTAPSTAGQTATLRFTITNPGSATATPLSFFDDLDAVLPGLVATNLPLTDVCGLGSEVTGASVILVQNASLPPAGGTCSFDVTVQLPANAAGGSYLNTTSVLTRNGLTVSDPATATLEVLEADLVIGKTDGVTVAVPGQSVTYTIEVTNSGPNDEPSALVSDTFPADLTCTYSSVAAGGASGNTASGSGDISDTLSLPVGSTVTYTAVCAIAPGATGTLSNTAVVAGQTVADLDLANNSATDDDTVLAAQADLGVTKTDGLTTAVPGESLVYTIVASNAGPSVEPEATLTDVFPAVLTCTFTSVAAGGATGNTPTGSGNLFQRLFMPVGSSVTYTITCDIDSDVAGTLSNTADISSSVTDPNSANDSATDDDTVLSPEANLGITKTDGVTEAVPGQSVTYTIVASNAGPSADPAASVADVFPANLSCAYTSVAAGGASGNIASSSGDILDTISLPVGSTVTYTAVCDIAPGATGTLSNTATVTASVTDPVSGNNSATDDDTVLQPQADLAVTKTDGLTQATPGESLTYVIVASNLGPSDDPAASLTDVLPSTLTCTFSSVAAGGASGNTASGAGDLAETLSLPVGSSVTYTVVCDIDSSATGTLSNTATITSSVTDPAAANNSATDDDTQLLTEANLSVTKTDGVTEATPGRSVTYTIVAANAGPSDEPGSFLEDLFPDELTCTYTSVAAGGATGNTEAGSGDISDTALVMPSGASVTYTAVCQIAPSATGTLENTAFYIGAGGDPDTSDNTAVDDDTLLVPEADLGVVKTGTLSVTVGGEATYSLAVSNQGPSDAVSVTLDDPTPAGLNFASATAPCAGGFPCDLGTLAPGDEVTVTAVFEVPVDYAGPKPIVNVATVSSPAADPNAANDESTFETEVVLDAVPPTVTAVIASGEPLDECSTVREPITSIEVEITDLTSPIVIGNSVNSGFLLLASGPDGDFSTPICGPPAGDDQQILFQASVDASDPLSVVASLRLERVAGLEPGLYRLLVCDRIEDQAGNALDGDGDGEAGGDFVVPFFRADPDNLLLNAHFDNCPVTLEPWVAVATAPNAVAPGAPGTDDVDGSPLSASVAFSQTVAAPSGVAQCADLAATGPYEIGAQVRFLPAASAIGNLVLSCDYFAEPACAGAVTGSSSVVTLLEDEGGVWIEVLRDAVVPAGSASALCDFTVESATPTDLAFDVFLDALFFGPNSLLFIDDFESGDTGAWSATMP